MDRGILIVLSGFSGSGKGTIVKELVSRYPNYALSISMTSRAPRPGEQHGREYFFASREEFEQTIKDNGFVEYASYCGNYYGTPRAYVEEQLSLGHDVILEIEIQGAMKVKKQFPDAILLFVMPPSAQVLYERLVGRGTETPEVIRQRMQRAVQESEGIENYDYIIVNDDLTESVRNMHGVVQAAHSTPKRNMQFIDDIRSQLTELKLNN